MSRDTGGIFIKFYFKFTFKNWRSLITGLEKAGYYLQINTTKGIQYLPLGSKFNEFDWRFETISKEKLFQIINRKVQLDEQIGFCLFPLEKSIDDLTISNYTIKKEETVIAFYLSSAAKTIDGRNVTDFSAYLQLIVPACYEVSKEFNIDCRQYIDR